MKPFTEALKYEFDLKPESVVIDAGSHEGNWSFEMWSRYKCHVVALEPIPEYIAKTYERLGGTGAKIIPLGLSGTTGLACFKTHGALSGEFADGPEQIVGMIGIQFLMRLLNLSRCDLLKMNIEGGEFDVLERILANGMASQFVNIIVQPHTVVPEYEARWKAIQEGLAKTHECVWAEPWCWEGWRLK